MEREGNYTIQANQAKAHFLGYDQEKLIRKLGLRTDGSWLYTALFGVPYRIHRTSASIERQRQGQWQDANSYEEVMTLLDLVCDSREDRHPSGGWKNMQDFGHGFHQQLLEQRDPWAERFQERPEALARACQRMGGEAYPLGDVAYSIPVFDGLCLLVQLWFGDEEFPAQLRYLWDENALQYLKYETMYYAIPLIIKRIEENME